MCPRKKKGCEKVDVSEVGSAQRIANALRTPGVSRIVLEGPAHSGRSTAVDDAIREVVGGRCTGDWVIRVGIDNMAVLKSMVGFSSIATYTSTGSYRIVLLDNADDIADSRGGVRVLLPFLVALRNSSTMKAILVFRDLRSAKNAKRKKLFSADYCDCLVKHTQLPMPTYNPRLVLDRAIDAGRLGPADFSYLVAMRTEACEALQERVAAYSPTGQVDRTDLRHAAHTLDAAILEGCTDNFDDAANAMSAGIRILSAFLTVARPNNPKP